MKNAILNLYQRDYFTFYLLLTVLDLVSFAIFKVPIIILLVCGIQIVLSSITILRKFKK